MAYGPGADVPREDRRRRGAGRRRMDEDSKALHRSRRQEEALRDVLSALSGAISLRDVAELVTRTAVETTHAFGGYVERISKSESDGEVEVEVVAVAGRGVPSVGHKAPFPGSLTEAVIQSGEPEIVTEVGAIGESMAPYLQEICRRCTGLVVPLSSEGRILGALVLLRSAGQEPFDREGVEFARALGDAASSVLWRVLILEQVERDQVVKTALLESVGEGIVGLDGEGRVTFVNRAALDILGYDRADLLGRVIHDLVHHAHPDGRPYPRTECPILQVLRSRSGVRVDGEVFWRKDGTPVPVAYSAHPIFEGSRVRGVALAFSDVTESREAERRLEESEERYRSLFIHNPDAAYSMDLDGRFTSANPAMERLTGLPANRLVGRSYHELFAPEERGRVDAHVRRAFEGDPQRFETKLLRPDGRRIAISVTAVPIIVRGQVVGLYGIVEDITERKRAEEEREELIRRAQEAQEEAERRAREEAALRRAAAAVSATFTVQGVIRQIAQSSIEATGAAAAFIERVDIERREITVVATAGDEVPAVGLRAPYDGSLAKRVIERGEAEVIPDLGKIAPPHLEQWVGRVAGRPGLVVPLLDPGGAIGALILVGRKGQPIFRPDEVSRASTFGNLAALAFRKVHLLEDSESKRRELEALMESRNRLMRGFSHDVKNPLGAADGYAQILEEGIPGPLSEDQRASVARLRRSIRSALDLIDDLVELARAEAGQIEIEYSPVDVRLVINEMTEEYRAAAESKGLELRVNLPETLPIIKSNSDRVRQILGNLISNAVKYTPPQGRVTVTAEVRAGDDAPGPGDWIAIDVADTGPGIPEEKQHLLFREFVRLHEVDKPGAGLGLAISYRIARALGGTITVRSEVGVGSTFTLWLPIPGSEGPQADEPPAKEPSTAESSDGA